MTRIRIPALDTEKVIKDPIHGFIPLTRLEYAILQLPIFNRLHDLKQMAMAYLVYPGAVTSRFSHSSGTMHLASKLTYQLLQSVDDDSFGALFPDGKTDAARQAIVQIVRLATLLHDIGHGPFSHTTEEIMGAALRESSSSEFEAAARLFGDGTASSFAVHEYYSYSIIKSGELKETIESEVLRKTRGGEVLPFTADDVASLISKAEPNQPRFATEDGLLLLRKLVSSQLDADRMDYLQRDSYMAGVPYGKVDVDHVIQQMLVFRDETNGYELAVHERAIGGVEDVLDARFKMYKWLYSHHMVVAVNEVLKEAVLSLIEDRKLRLNDFYWKRFLEIRTSDSHVMPAVLKAASDPRSPFHGLVDRRYLPVSILKRPTDHTAFKLDAQAAMKKEIPEDQLRGRLFEFIRKVREEPELDVAGERVRIFAVPVPRSPYKPVREEDNVWVYSGASKKLHELTRISGYFAAINQEWFNFPSFYFSYVVPGKRKQEASALAESVKKEIISGVAA